MVWIGKAEASIRPESLISDGREPRPIRPEHRISQCQGVPRTIQSATGFPPIVFLFRLPLAVDALATHMTNDDGAEG
jgi:hypothetical protein